MHKTPKVMTANTDDKRSRIVGYGRLLSSPTEKSNVFILKNSKSFYFKSFYLKKFKQLFFWRIKHVAVYRYEYSCTPVECGTNNDDLVGRR